ncbi:EI24 domain-containing protein [Sphingomonas hankookensis]|uniref:EI24 domain-containing protein n=1 Tax=Sphingomonas hankookensis TaxID=563996 RepID=UPI003D301CD3
MGARWITTDLFVLGDDAGTLAAIAAVIAAVGLAWLLFRIVAIAVIGLFADEVVEAVEAKHYPAALATARPVPPGRSLAMSGTSALRALAVNAFFLPLYLLLLATGIGTAAVFFVVNGWLLGRDLSDMVAARHLPPAAMPAERSASGGRRFLLGLIGTGLLMIPFVNFIAPLVGAAMATHAFHRRRSKGAGNA